MATGESLVFRGMEGTGAAQIFGRPGDPMGAYRERKLDIQRQQVIAMEYQRLQREKRDKDTWALVNQNPDKAYEPFNQQVADAAAKHRAEVVRLVEERGAADEQVKLYAQKGWDNINVLAAKSNYIKDQIEATRKTIKDDPYLVPEYYHGKLNDLYLNPDGTAKPLDAINVLDINDIYVKDPMGFNATKYHKDFIGGLNDNMSNYVRQSAQNGGLLTEDIETKWKGNLYTPDPTSSTGVVTDDKGVPILNYTKDLSGAYQSSPTAQRFYNATAQQAGLTPDEMIQQQFQISGGGLQQNIRPTFSREPKQSKWEYEAQNPGLDNKEKEVTGRVFEHIGNLVNAFYDPETGARLDMARPEAREALGYFVNQKYGGGTITEAQLVPGTNKPGSTQFLGKSVPNSPDDRIVLKIQTSKGSRVEDIDLIDEGAPSTLWNTFQTSGYLGKKNIAIDYAAQQLNLDPRTLYKGREFTAQRQQAEQTAINDWTKGENFNQMRNKSYQGKGIEDVKLNESWLGNLKGYDLTLSDGSTKFVGKDDYEALTRIFRADKKAPEEPKATSPATDTVVIQQPDGKKRRIPKDKLPEAIKHGAKQIE